MLPLWLVLMIVPGGERARADMVDTCYWRSGSTVQAEVDGWFACNNTKVDSGGAQLCCKTGSQCGEDSICHGSYPDDPGSAGGWYVGGCTDMEYTDPVCRQDCSEFQKACNELTCLCCVDPCRSSCPAYKD